MKETEFNMEEYSPAMLLVQFRLHFRAEAFVTNDERLLDQQISKICMHLNVDMLAVCLSIKQI